MFVKSLLVLTLGALSVSASPIKPQVGTSEAALRERSLIPDFFSFDKREVASPYESRVVKRSAFADVPAQGSLAKRAPPKTAKQRAAARKKALAAKKAAKKAAAAKKKQQQAVAAARKQALAAARQQAASPAAARVPAAAAAPARVAPAAVAGPAAVVAAAPAAVVAAAAGDSSDEAPAQSTPNPPSSDRAALIAAVRAAAAAVGNPPSGANRPSRPSTFCSSDQACAVGNNIAVLGPSSDPNALPRCNFGPRTCYYGCRDGFGLVNGQCVANQGTCDGQVCGTAENGIFTCSNGGTSGTCQLQCDTAGGYTNVAGQCRNNLTDPEFCGPTPAEAVVCPASYNGKGSPVCRLGNCNITCYGGTIRVLNGQRYCDSDVA